jgi:ATP phosphoribosyltransferase regulatory subunit
MTAETARQFDALEAQAQRLMAVFTRAGYEHVAPAIIQPAGPFLDVVGENVRARTYVFTDPEGEELCLRPDLTVPTCRLHLARHPSADTRARYCYNGPAFRFQPGGTSDVRPREFRQAGIESFAARDREAEDAAVLALIVEAVRAVGLGDFTIRLGDLGVFSALLEALDMPDRWRRRLRHRFWRPDAFRAEVQRLTSPQPAQPRSVPPSLLNGLDPADPQGAEIEIARYLEKAGIELVGTRTLSEIAERLLAAAADARTPPLTQRTAALIEDYLAVRTRAGEAAIRLRRLTSAYEIDLSQAIDAFQRRLELLQKAGMGNVAHAEFSAEFGRNLEYYTGFVFELLSPQLGPASPLAGGGRYDTLLKDLGAPAAVPAVGSCIHTERLLAVTRGAP